MIKCCIFDLDGTVLDTISTITHFVNVTLQKHGFSEITEEECKVFVGDGARVLMRRTLASKNVFDEGVVETLLSDYDRAYNSDPLYLTDAFSGICDVLSKLRIDGMKLALLSNKQHGITKNVSERFFPGLFDVVYGGRDGFPLKPDPTVAKSVIEELGVSASETAWVGDTSTDIQTAKNLGASLSIGVLWGFRKKEELILSGADVILEEPREIYTAIKEYA